MNRDLLINKTATLEHAVRRAEEEYSKNSTSFDNDQTRIDAAILNIERACEAALDIANHLIRSRKLGMPQSPQEAFELLEQASLIPSDLAEKMKEITDFCHLAIHDDQAIRPSMVISIIEKRLNDLLTFSKTLLQL